MTAVAGAQPTSQLQELCGQFEEVLLRTLIPRSMAHSRALASDNPEAASEDGGMASGDSAADGLFALALAAALERAGGLGLRREMLGWLERKPN